MGKSADMLGDLPGRSMGLEPEWEVASSEFLEVEGGRDELHVRIEHVRGRAVGCPGCGRRCGACDTREREWRHLDIWQFKTITRCAVPRCDCPEHGVRTVGVPWEGDHGALTSLFEAQVLAMAMGGMPVSRMAATPGCTDTRLWRLVAAAVGRAGGSPGLSGVTAVGVDETSCGKGHDYVTSFVDAGGRRVVLCTHGRDGATVGRLAEDLEAHGGDAGRVAAVTCDMSPAFARGVAEGLPDARRVIDKFHVAQLLARAVDKVRNAEMRSSREKGALPRGTKYVWPRNEGSLTDGQLAKKRGLSREHLKTARACQTREAPQSAYGCPTRGEAEAELGRLTSWMMHPDIPETRTVARTLRKNMDEIPDYFDLRMTNAALEGLNSIIQGIKAAARGFSNPDYFIARIYLRLGKLDLPLACYA